MSLQTIRSLFERKITAAFAGLSPSVPVVYDNVKKAPSGAAKEYVSLILSFPSLTEPIISKTESSIEVIRGIVQVNCYGPKAKGMKRLEELAATAASTLNTLKTEDTTIRASVGEISGPVNIVNANKRFNHVDIAKAADCMGHDVVTHRKHYLKWVGEEQDRKRAMSLNIPTD